MLYINTYVMMIHAMMKASEPERILHAKLLKVHSSTDKQPHTSLSIFINHLGNIYKLVESCNREQSNSDLAEAFVNLHGRD